MISRWRPKFFYAPDGGADGNGNQGTPETTQTTAQENAAVGSEGSTGAEKASTPGWMAQLPNEYKGNPELAKFSNIGEMAKAFMDLKGTKPEDKSAETQEEPKQEFKPYENWEKALDKRMDLKGDTSKILKDFCENNKISQAEAEKLFASMNENHDSQIKAILKEGKNIVEAGLKETWKDSYDANRRDVTKALRAYDESGELQKQLETDGGLFCQSVWNLLAAVGKGLREDNPNPSTNDGSNATKRNDFTPVHYPGM